jgi:hypothetical protein
MSAFSGHRQSGKDRHREIPRRTATGRIERDARARRVPLALTHEEALDLMKTGSRLVKIIGRGGAMWFVIPGGQVTDVIADQIKQHPAVVGQKDGLFPHHDQTWRMRRCSQPS